MAKIGNSCPGVVLAASAIAIVISCGAPVERRVEAPQKRPPVITDRNHYRLVAGPFVPETTIVTTFRAPADTAVYLENETIVVVSGADAVVSARRTGIKIDTGTYRVVWIGVYTSFDMNAHPFGEELPLEQRVSEPITIEAAP